MIARLNASKSGHFVPTAQGSHLTAKMRKSDTVEATIRGLPYPALPGLFLYLPNYKLCYLLNNRQKHSMDSCWSPNGPECILAIVPLLDPRVKVGQCGKPSGENGLKAGGVCKR